jgi:hypothetical protein
LLIDCEADAIGEKAHRRKRRHSDEQGEHENAQLARLAVAKQREQRQSQRFRHVTNRPASILMMRLQRCAIA